jgi:hypothetical protein
MTDSIFWSSVSCVGMTVLFISVRQWCPAETSQYSLEELEQEFGKQWDRWVGRLWVALMVVQAVALGWLFGKVFGGSIESSPEMTGPVVVSTPTWFYFIPALAMALGLATLTTVFGLRAILGGIRAKRLAAYLQLLSGYSQIRFFTLLSIPFFLVGAFLLVFFVSSRFELSEKGVSDGEGLRPFESINGLYDVAHLRSSDNPHYVIEFKDGSHWSSDSQPGFFHHRYRWILERIARKTGRQIQPIEKYAKEE